MTQLFDIEAIEIDDTAAEIIDPRLRHEINSQETKLQTELYYAPTTSIYEDNIETYCLFGHPLYTSPQEFKTSTLIELNSQTTEVKTDPHYSRSAINYIWNSMKGFSNNELYCHYGWMYILERVAEGRFYVHGGWNLTQLVTVYYDKDREELRLIFDSDVMKQVTLGVNDKESVLKSLKEALVGTGLSLLLI